MKLRTKKEPVWVEVEVDGDKARFYINPATPKDDFTYLKKATKTEWERNQRFQELDAYKFKMNKIHDVIIDWEGIEDEEGNPIECTEKNRELVYLLNPDIIDKVLVKAELIASSLQAAVEGIIKN